MGFPLGVNDGGEVFVQPEDRAAHVANGALRLGQGREGIAFLIGVDFFEFPADFGFDRFGSMIIFQDGFEFLDFPAQRLKAFRFFDAEVQLDDRGVAGQRLQLAGKRVCDQSLAPFIRKLAEKGQCFEFESDAVDGFVGRIEQEIGDVVGALLVVEARFLAVER